MKRIVALVVIIFIVVVSTGQENKVPANYKFREEAYGDLDKDGINEKVVVYDIITPDNEQKGIDREIIIYKKIKENWKIWHRSKKAVKNSTEGQSFDPFEGIEITKGVLIIYHFGGGYFKWSHTDRYRLQNDHFELIGFKNFSGQPCEEWFGFDYNITTGKIIVTDEFEKCEGDKQAVYKKKNETFIHKLPTPILFETRHERDVKIISPKYKHELDL
ncbi:MAG: hypothetical protein V4557_14535 [Bacteroidota bacterium]